MKIFLIALPKFTQRFEYVTKHLRHFSSFDVEIVGVDGSVERDNVAPEASHLNAGQIGCALSHAKACQSIVDQNLEWGLVLEDDIILPKNFDTIAMQAAKLLKQGGIINLYSPAIQTGKYSMQDRLPLNDFELIIPMEVRFVRTTAAYIIHKDAAAAIARGNRPVRFVADGFNHMYSEGWLNYVSVLHPTPLAIKGFQSTIGYQASTSLKARLGQLLNMLPIAKDILTWRREFIRRNLAKNNVFVPEKSPISAANPAFAKRLMKPAIG